MLSVMHCLLLIRPSVLDVCMLIDLDSYGVHQDMMI